MHAREFRRQKQEAMLARQSGQNLITC
jgi:hypothetical protein